MANQFWNQFNEEDIRLDPVQSIDLSKLPKAYNRQFGEQSRIEEEQRNIASQQLQQDAYNNRQDILAQQQRAIGQNTMGIAGEYGRQGAENQIASVLSQNEIKKLYEDQAKKQSRINMLRQQMAEKQIGNIGRQHQVEMQKFSRDFSDLRQSVANKMYDEQMEAQGELQAEYEQSINNIQETIMRRKKTNRWLGALGAIGGMFIPGVNILTGAMIGSSLAKGAQSVFGRNRYAMNMNSGITF